jgi:predicted nucleic acid-binding protein
MGCAAEWPPLSSAPLTDGARWTPGRRLGVTRYPTFALLDRVWALRDNLSAYEASYVALAELLGWTRLTADARLSRAPAVRCAITTVTG